MALRRLLAIRTRWLVVAMIASVSLIAGLAYWQEHTRWDAQLVDLGAEQAAVAEAADLVADPAALARLERPGLLRVLRLDGTRATTLDGAVVTVPGLADAIARGEHVLRVQPDDAGVLGLPERTAMIGIAGNVAVAATAERQRDRDRATLRRRLLTVILTTGLVSAFGGLALVRQRSQLELARELQVADVARARDAELERLSRAATMAAVGSGVAHELSTPLGVIVGRAEQIVARAGGDERIVKNAQAILDQADHIDRVVRGLLGLARGAPIAMQEAEPRTLVAEAAALVEHRFVRAGVRLVREVAAQLPAIRCEPLLFKHALVNLLLNACDASPAGATVRVEVVAQDAAVAFVVTDEGEGITEATAARAMEPFFTTKPAGQGTGLGLAIAREIASTHRGQLALAAREPRGTCARITIPVSHG